MTKILPFPDMLTEIGECFEREFGDCGDFTGWTVYTDDVTQEGVLVAGQGYCGRLPVVGLHEACQRSETAGDQALLTDFIERHVG